MSYESNLACSYWDRGILTNKTVLLNSSNVTLFEKTSKIFYLSYVNVHQIQVMCKLLIPKE
jgi:hypothetical protein